MIHIWALPTSLGVVQYFQQDWLAEASYVTASWSGNSGKPRDFSDAAPEEKQETPAGDASIIFPDMSRHDYQ